jgi:hypothetical protein
LPTPPLPVNMATRPTPGFEQKAAALCYYGGKYVPPD